MALVRPGGAGGPPLVTDFVTGLRQPHDLVFHTIGGTTYVYVSESNQINRYVWHTGDLTGQNREVVITGLPDASTPELKGNYGHQLKNIALDGNHKLYVSIASTCNACLSDTQSDPVRGPPTSTPPMVRAAASSPAGYATLRAWPLFRVPIRCGWP
ncbi:MAG: hypothetical protein WKG07_28225 [Hymenobacter sp.]